MSSSSSIPSHDTLSALSRFLQRRQMPPAKSFVETFFPSTAITIEVYEARIRELLPFGPIRTRFIDAKVRKVLLLKDNNASQHESVVMECIDEERGLQVERTLGVQTFKKSTKFLKFIPAAFSKPSEKQESSKNPPSDKTAEASNDSGSQAGELKGASGAVPPPESPDPLPFAAGESPSSSDPSSSPNSSSPSQPSSPNLSPSSSQVSSDSSRTSRYYKFLRLQIARQFFFRLLFLSSSSGSSSERSTSDTGPSSPDILVSEARQSDASSNSSKGTPGSGSSGDLSDASTSFPVSRPAASKVNGSSSSPKVNGTLMASTHSKSKLLAPETGRSSPAALSDGSGGQPSILSNVSTLSGYAASAESVDLSSSVWMEDINDAPKPLASDASDAPDRPPTPPESPQPDHWTLPLPLEYPPPPEIDENGSLVPASSWGGSTKHPTLVPSEGMTKVASESSAGSGSSSSGSRRSMKSIVRKAAQVFKSGLMMTGVVSLSSVVETLASDRIVAYNPTPGDTTLKDCTVRVMTFEEGHCPPLWKVILGCSAAHQFDEKYKLLLHQCYWYAGTIFLLLECMVGKGHYDIADGPMSPENDNFALRPKKGKNSKRPRRAGNWKWGLPVYKHRNSETAALVELFAKLIEEFEDEVKKAEEIERLLVQAQKQAGRDELRAETAEQLARAEEERRTLERRAEEERRALERRAEEERLRAEEERRALERRAEEERLRAEEERRALERRAEERERELEEERRRAEEERRRAEEERRRAEQREWQLEEERRRAEEERRRAEQRERELEEERRRQVETERRKAEEERWRAEEEHRRVVAERRQAEERALSLERELEVLRRSVSPEPMSRSRRVHYTGRAYHSQP